MPPIIIKGLIGLLVLLVLSALAAIIAYLITKIKNAKWWLPLFMGAAFTGITLLFLQNKSVFFKEEAVAPALIHSIKQQLFYKDLDAGFITKNFVLVNSATNPMLVNSNEGIDEDSIRHVIADRRMLQRLLHFLNAHRNAFTLIACDLIFTDSSQYDAGLLEEFRQLSEKNKLVLAYNHGLASLYPSFYDRVGTSCLGDITKVKDESFYFSHHLLSADGYPSFPYLMNIKIKGIHSRLSDDKVQEDAQTVFQAFIPEFFFTNEAQLYTDSLQAAETEQLHAHPDTTLTAVGPSLLYTLGALSGKSGQQELLDRLQAGRDQSMNIIFIGNFSDPYTDRHATAYGTLYGTTILLNDFFYIFQGYYKMNNRQLASYIGILFFCYSGIFLFIVLNCLRYGRAATDSTKKKALKEWLIITGKFTVNEIHFVFLFLTVFIIDLRFHKIVNLMGMLYLFAPFTGLLKFFIRHLPETAKEKKHDVCPDNN